MNAAKAGALVIRAAPSKTGEATVLYVGASLYDRLLRREPPAVADSECLSSADDRMWALAQRIDHVDLKAADPEALYQVAVWALLEHPDYFTGELCGAVLLAKAADAGHLAARFVLAKAVVDGIWWAEDETSPLSGNDDAKSLAEEWLSELAQMGYSDALLEYACLKWAAGDRDAAACMLRKFDDGDAFPEASIRSGILLMPSDLDRAMELIDEGEEKLSAGYGGLLIRLEDAFAETSGCSN